MMRLTKLAALVCLISLATASSAFAQCSGQGASGSICGNAAASLGLPKLDTLTNLLNRSAGSLQGSILYRDSSTWAASRTPTLGLNGTAGGSLTFAGSTSGSSVVRVPAAAGTSTVFQLPGSNGTNGFVLVTDGNGVTSWASNASGGTVTSVALAMPGIFSVSGSPVTTSGTLTATLATQTANSVWAGPTSGGAATPTFRSLVNADIPVPTTSALGGIQAVNAVTSNWIRSINTSGVPALSQPAFTDISGTLAAAQCPNPSASTLGCIQSFALQSSKWISSISTSGVPSATQPAFSDVSGNATLAQLPSISDKTVLANNSGGTGIPSALTASQILDMIGSTQGQVLYRGASAWSVLGVGTNGQVLTTSGAAANPTWTTVTGTGTVTNIAAGTGISTGGSAITTTGTVSLDTIANNRILANTSGITAIPSATTISSVLDILSSTTGAVLYRAAGGTGWQALAAGTNGQVLTQGASTPSWANAGTLTNVTVAASTGLSTSGTCNITTTGTCTLTNSGVVTVKKQVFAASGTYTPSSGMLYTMIECVGSGGGGGSAHGTGTGNYGGGGGGSGSYSRVLATAATIGASKTVTIGAFGAGGASGSNNGSAGADSCVTSSTCSSGNIITGKGGAGGLFSSASQVGIGGAGGVAGTGDFIPFGSPGQTGLNNAPGSTFGPGAGIGGSSYFGGGATAPSLTTGAAAAGVAAGNYGSGGSGGASYNFAGDAAGGNGSTGGCFFTDYNSQ